MSSTQYYPTSSTESKSFSQSNKKKNLKAARLDDFVASDSDNNDFGGRGSDSSFCQSETSVRPSLSSRTPRSRIARLAVSKTPRSAYQESPTDTEGEEEIAANMSGSSAEQAPARIVMSTPKRNNTLNRMNPTTLGSITRQIDRERRPPSSSPEPNAVNQARSSRSPVKTPRQKKASSFRPTRPRQRSTELPQAGPSRLATGHQSREATMESRAEELDTRNREQIEDLSADSEVENDARARVYLPALVLASLADLTGIGSRSSASAHRAKEDTKCSKGVTDEGAAG